VSYPHRWPPPPEDPWASERYHQLPAHRPRLTVVPYLPAQPARHTGRTVALVLIAVLLALGVAGFVAAQPILREYPARVGTPDSVAGMPMLTDAHHQQLAGQVRDQLNGSVPLARPMAAFYAPDDDRTRVVLGVAGTQLLLNPGGQLNDVFRGFSDRGIAVTAVTPVDPGPMGGSTRCGQAQVAGVPMAICAWADHGSMGIVVGYRRGVPESAELMRTIRTEVVHRN